MSDLIARQALARMNLNVIAIAPAYGAAALAADLAHLAKTDPVEAQAKFMEQKRFELCAAYGFNEPTQRKPFAFAAGLAIIPISGTLINRFGGSYGSVTGYNFIRQQTAQALADDDVKGILYDVNSYGGEAAGCFECSAFIREAGKIKPTMSFIDSNAYSAGYALASAANKVVSTPSGGAGSIGVVAMHVDMSKALKDFGISVTFIHFGEHKVDGNPFEPLPDDVKASIQVGVNKSGEAFVALVATNMKMDAKKVRDTQARTYRADDALSLGLIDAIVSPEAAAQAFLGELSGSISQPVKKEDAMSQAEQPGANQGAAGTQAGAVAAGTQAGTPAQPDLATAQAEARTAERARMSGILGCEEAKGREALANHFAMNTSMSVDEAKAALAAAPKAEADKPAPAANGFAAAMDRTPNPNVGANGGGGEGAGAEGLTAAQQILAAQERATGFKQPTAAAK